METTLELKVGRQLNQNQTLNELQMSASTLCFPRFIKQKEAQENVNHTVRNINGTVVGKFN